MKTILIVFICTLTAVHLRAGTNEAPVKLAIISESPETASAADVLTTDFTKNEKVQLLERAEIEKVYREQELSAANRDYLKLGQILGADGLLLLAAVKDGASQSLNVRLIAVKPGVVLAAEKFPQPEKDLAEWAKAFAKHLDGYFPKLTVLLKDAIPISVVNLRSALQSDEAKETERQLKLLTIQRLSREPQFFVLERERMQLLTEEKDLKLDDSAFWKGSYLLEGTIDRDGYSHEKMTISVQLIPSKGGVTQKIELSVSRTNLTDAVNELAERVLKTLKLNQSAISWNAVDESEQFFSEAKWAYRWGLLAQAQAASESAWALGKHTEEVAALRIRAYGNAARLGDDCVEISAVPDASKLEPIRRALDLFDHDARLIFTNTSPNVEWADLEHRTLRIAIGMLEGFYYAAEARSGQEEQLIGLRTSAREVLGILCANPPSTNLFSDCHDFDWLKWEESGICFEKPEKPLPIYRRMLEAGYHPTHLPRMVGWSWEDRKRVPHLLERWIQELCASTNLSVQLEGRYLALMHATFDAEGHLQVTENELVNSMWEHRDWVLSSTGNASIIQRTEDVLGEKYSPWHDSNQYFDHEPFASVRQRLRKEYLLTADTFDISLFEKLFPQKTQIVSDCEAQELAPLAEQFAQKIQAKPYYVGRVKSLVLSLKRQAGIATTAAQTNATPVALPAEKPLLVRFVRWNLNSPDTDSSRRPEFQSLVVRNKRLWSEVYYRSPMEMASFDSPPTAFVSADPESGSCDVIPFPDNLGRPDGFEVTEDSLYVSVQNHLERYRFQAHRWETIPVPTEGRAQIFSLHGCLYLATADSLLEVEPNSQKVQILISARRTPPISELDSLWEPGSRIYLRGDGKLGAIIAGRYFAFVPDTHVWEQGSRLPVTKINYLKVPFASHDGVELLLTGGGVRRRLLGLWNDTVAIDLLLEQPWQHTGERPDPDLEKALGSPRWDWPQPFDLEASSVAGEGRSLWILNPRQIWTMPFSTSVPVAFADDRQATLFRFESGVRQPFSVPVRFESNDNEIDPFDPGRGKFPGLWQRLQQGMNDVPFWLETPQGLVFSSPLAGGHWLISKSALEPRLQEQRESFRRKSISETKSANTATGDLKP